MWIVVVVESHYPSVLHFDNEKEAQESFEKNKEEGHVTHIAKVKETFENFENYQISSDFNAWDVGWHGVSK